MDIQSIITSVHHLSDKSLGQLADRVEVVEYPKGHILMHADRVETYVYFIEKGIARAYTLHDGEEITFWFGLEGGIIYSIRNYIENRASYENVDLLEDCILHRIKTSDLLTMYEHNIELANWGRKLAEYQLIITENRLIDQQFLSATERYDALLTNTPNLLQRVPLGIIASYLGITQVSLSRIRARN